MLPSEMVILMAIAVNRSGGEALLTRPMDVTGEYIGYLYNSLVIRGYLKKRRSNSYHLTPTGREAILEFLSKNGARARDFIKRFQFLGIDIGPDQEHKIDRLEKKATKG